MSRVDWLEIDGKRVPEEEVTRIAEYRCDICGQFVAEPVTLQAQLFAWRGMTASLPQYHFHGTCLDGRMPFVAKDARRQGMVF